MTPEGQVKQRVNKTLDKYGVYRFMPVQMGMGSPGLDYYCCWYGAFFAIETKAPGKKLTARQEITKEKIEAAGGMVFVIDGTDWSFTRLEIWLDAKKRAHDREQGNDCPRTEP